MSTNEVGFSLQTLSTLTFLTLNAHGFFHVLCIDTLGVLHVLDVDVCLGFDSLGLLTCSETA